MFGGPELSIVLPVFNEEASIEHAIRQSIVGANAVGLRHEVLAVDDGSVDRTAEILDRLESELTPTLRVLRHPENRGYGVALRTGFEHALGDLVFYTDADYQFDMADRQHGWREDIAEMAAAGRIHTAQPAQRAEVVLLAWPHYTRDICRRESEPGTDSTSVPRIRCSSGEERDTR